MEIVLSIKNDEYNLEKVEANNKKRTNNQDKIWKIISSINISAIRATYYNKDVKLFFGEGRYVTLKDYQKNKNLELYSNVLNCINENTRVIKNVSNINKKTIKRIALTGTIVLSLTFLGTSIVNGKKNIPNAQTITITPTIKPTTIPTPTIIPTATPTVTPAITPVLDTLPKSFEDRFNESMLICKSNNFNFEGIALTTGYTEYFCKKVLECSKSEIWDYMNKYGEEFGVDPYLILAICYNETNLEHEKTIPGGSSYNGCAVGIGQHENPNGTNKITAFNYKTGEYETEVISMENACDLEKNIKMTTMLIQNKLKKYNNNIYAAIQSYNYGDWAMNVILNEYGRERKLSIDEILNDYTDTGWMKYVEYFHNNPQEYLSNWNYKTYGDSNYVKKVMGYYIGTESVNTLSDGSKVSINLVTLENTYETKKR